MEYYRLAVPSPVGKLLLIASTEALCALLWEKEEEEAQRRFPAAQQQETPLLHEARQQLEEYFAGSRQTFSLPLAPQGTPFQQKVWQALRAIPYGETRSYGQQAAMIGNPKASRAVGAANGKNPISIIVPCHRVIGTSGALTGFGGGLDIKAMLLAHEQRFAVP
jgi:methylated-DNA-[protein]-cysteine S-methyltransferase